MLGDMTSGMMVMLEIRIVVEEEEEEEEEEEAK
jgi:hypothetical protein